MSIKSKVPSRTTCAETRQPLYPGQDVFEVTFRAGVMNQDGEFAPLTESERRIFVSKDAVHRYTAPRYQFPIRRRIP